MPDRRRTFGPLVLLGLASAGLTAVAGEKPAVDGDAARSGATGLLQLTFEGDMPLVTALALVVLACWGVLLVTRGRVRRAVAVLGCLGAVGSLVAVVAAYSQVSDDLRDQLAQVGVTDPDVSHTTWYWVALAGSLVSVACVALAVAWVPSWPEMGRRYDAPGAGPAAEPVEQPGEASNLDLWKAMDEGRDPTA